jgi:outer membrane protein
MAKMPAMLDAKTIRKIKRNLWYRLQKMVEEYQAKLKKYEAESATVTDAINGSF